MTEFTINTEKNGLTINKNDTVKINNYFVISFE